MRLPALSGGSRPPAGTPRLSDETASDLIQRVAQHDRAAFRALYALTAPKLAGVLTRMLKDRSEVEDAMQEVYVRIWQRAGQFSADRGSAMGWLVAVARNLALDRLRARPPQGARLAGEDPLALIPDPAVGVEARLAAAGQARRILGCLDEQEPDRAEALRGAYLVGLSYQDLAERHGIPLNTMRTWLRRGLQRLRECLER